MASNWYPAGSRRLAGSMKVFGDGTIDLLQSVGGYPAGCPKHEERPFAFKAHMLRMATDRGYRTIVWADCSVWAVGMLAPYFAEIERAGFIWMNDGWSIGQWSSDRCLSYYGWDRETALRRPALTTMLWGVSMDSPAVAAWADDFCRDCQNPDLLHGSLSSVAGEPVVDPCSKVDLGVISHDPRVLGHAREQTIAGILAHVHGLLPFTNSPKWLDRQPPNRRADARACWQAAGM